MLKVWCLLRDQFAHVKPVESFFANRATFIYDAEWNPDTLISAQPDIVLTVNDYHYDVARCLQAARERAIPSLVLQDGILEWRCQYENPLFGAGGGAPQHQPVLADKIACLGLRSASTIASWGNTARVEVTGMPRLDVLQDTSVAPVSRPGRRILVMTAKNPGFTSAQREVTRQSLQALKEYLDQRHDIEVIWRVTTDLDKVLGVPNRLVQLSGSDLLSAISASDAVITTFSTTMLESMLLDRPVACLDFHNVPRFVETAWTISSADHIDSVVSEILNPRPEKILFQRHVLQENLFPGLASPRVAQLMERMVAFRHVHADGTAFPANMLDYSAWFPERDSTFNLSAIYPQQDAFKDQKLEDLQARAVRLESELGRLRHDNEQLKNRLSLLRLFKRFFGR